MGRVLVVDDDADTAEAMRRLLTRRGHVAAAVEGGSQALAWLAEQAPLPDVIVLDWMMPMIGGADVLRAIRAQAAYRDIRVIIFSGAYENELVRTARLLGADDYVGKGTLPWDAMVRKIEALMPPAQDAAPQAQAAEQPADGVPGA